MVDMGCGVVSWVARVDGTESLRGAARTVDGGSGSSRVSKDS